LKVYFVVTWIEKQAGVDAVEVDLDGLAPFSGDGIGAGDDECIGFAGE